MEDSLTKMEGSLADQPYAGLHPMEADLVDTAEAVMWAAAAWAEAATDKFRADLEIC